MSLNLVKALLILNANPRGCNQYKPCSGSGKSAAKSKTKAPKKAANGTKAKKAPTKAAKKGGSEATTDLTSMKAKWKADIKKNGFSPQPGLRNRNPSADQVNREIRKREKAYLAKYGNATEKTKVQGQKASKQAKEKAAKAVEKEFNKSRNKLVDKYHQELNKLGVSVNPITGSKSFPSPEVEAKYKQLDAQHEAAMDEVFAKRSKGHRAAKRVKA